MSKIEWTEQTWNPIIGCQKISPGCDNCYAEKMAYRLASMEKSHDWDKINYKYVIGPVNKKWMGVTHFVKSQLDKPLKRKKPTMYFVCSMGDLFHESVPFERIDEVFEIISQAPQHTYQILTKRPDRMLKYYKWFGNKLKTIGYDSIPSQSDNMLDYVGVLPNVWLGVTAENQEMANKRIPILLQVPAKVRFVSVEPMLEYINLYKYLGFSEWLNTAMYTKSGYKPELDWVICGGETGHNARPMHAYYGFDLKKQCEIANIPFFFKSWGTWMKNSKGIYNKEEIKIECKQFPKI